MQHKYAFDKKTIRVLLSGFSGLALLLFAAGLVVGVAVSSAQHSLPDEVSVPIIPEKSAPDLNDTSATESSSSADDISKIGIVDENAGSNSLSGEPDLPDTDLTSDVVLPIGDFEPESGETPDQLPISKVSLHDSQPGTDLERPAMDESGEFAVQVGCFLSEENARRLKDRMAEKGYRARIFKWSDNLNRVWHAVRIGDYVSRAEALQAASRYREQQNQIAVVRPAGSL